MPRPTRVLLVAARTSSKRSDGHTYASATPLLIRLMTHAGYDVHISTNLDRVRGADLFSFDVILLHGNRSDSSTDPAIAALDDFVRQIGRGLIVIHIASNTFGVFNNAPPRRWVDLIGSAWVYADAGHSDPKPSTHPAPAPIDVTVDQPGHEIMRSVTPRFTIVQDELYANMFQGQPDPGLRLATGVVIENGKEFREPIAFALERDNGRVFHFYPGHFCSTYVNNDVSKMIIQGIQWCDSRLQ